MSRLFVAVWPTPDVVRVLTDLARPDVPGLRWTGPEQWHVTLRFLGRVDDLDGARAAFRSTAGLAATARMGPATGRFGDRVLHVPVAGLDALAAAVVDATAEVGEPPDGRPFSGHMTLARPRGRARVHLRPLTGKPLAGTWPVDEITLVSSTTLAAGARYDVVDRLPVAHVPGEVP